MIENTSGFEPTEYNILVRPHDVGEKIGSIYVPDQTREREQYAAQRGTIVAASPLAFSFEEWPGDMRPPTVGQTICFAKYAGARLKGRDDVDYVIMKDKDVLAVEVSS